MKRFKLLLATVLLSSLARPALAQTARIAHFSHGGSVETLDAAADNFGEIRIPFVVDSVRATSDTSAIEYGRLGYEGASIKRKEAHPVQLGDQGGRQQYIKYYQRNLPAVKLIGFDSTVKATFPLLPKKQRTKRKKAAFIPTTLETPQHPGVALAVAAILVLTGAGWLLGERPRPVAGPAA